MAVSCAPRWTDGGLQQAETTFSETRRRAQVAHWFRTYGTLWPSLKTRAWLVHSRTRSRPRQKNEPFRTARPWRRRRSRPHLDRAWRARRRGADPLVGRWPSVPHDARCSAVSMVPFGGSAALDTASAPRRVGSYRRPSKGGPQSDLPGENGSILGCSPSGERSVRPPR